MLRQMRNFSARRPPQIRSETSLCSLKDSTRLTVIQNRREPPTKPRTGLRTTGRATGWNARQLRPSRVTPANRVAGCSRQIEDSSRLKDWWLIKRLILHPVHPDCDEECEFCAVLDADSSVLLRLIEDASDKSRASGPAGMSDGLMTPRKKQRKSCRKMSAVGSKEPQKTLRDDSVSRRDLCKFHKLKKAGFDKFNEASHARRESENHLSWSPTCHESQKSPYRKLHTSVYHVFFGCPRCHPAFSMKAQNSSAVDTVLRVLFFHSFPIHRSFCSNEPCIVVVQVTTPCSLSFFIFHKLIPVIFRCLGWSSCCSLSSSRYDQSWVPLGDSSGPSIWALDGNQQGLSPFQFLLSFDPILGCCMSALFSSASLALLFMYSIQSS